MKPLLKKYLVLGIVAQFVLAGFVDFVGFLSVMYYQTMGMRIPAFTLLFISIRHWAFLWPVVVLVLTVVLLYKTRADSIRLHLLGGMMLVVIVVMLLALLSLFLPMIAMTCSLA